MDNAGGRVMRKRKSAFKKARDIRVTADFLRERHEWNAARGYPKSKWIEFCETLLAAGFHLTLYEARQTLSKYITVSDGNQSFKVRFSNHRPIKHRELAGDCDFFVGVTHTGYRTTANAVEAVAAFFGTEVREVA
jgi:hypothetical protein